MIKNRASWLPPPLAGVTIFLLGFLCSYFPHIDWYQNKIHATPSLYSGYSLSERFLSLFFRWDTGWYSKIAYEGYPSTDPIRLAFFPAWPAVMSGLKPVFGSDPRLLHLASMPIALICWTLSLFLWCKVIDRIPMFKKTECSWFPWLYAFYPTTLFCIIGYPDALFLLASSALLLSTVQGLKWPIFLSMALLVLTKHVGVTFGGLVLIWILLYRRQSFLPALAGFAISLAVISYLSWSVAGHPLAWAKAHESWKRQFGLPHLVFADLVGKGGVEMIVYAVFLFLGPLLIFRRLCRNIFTPENLLPVAMAIGILVPAWFSSTSASLYRILYLVPFLLVMLSEWLERRSLVSQYLFLALFLFMNGHATYRFVSGFALP